MVLGLDLGDYSRPSGRLSKNESRIEASRSVRRESLFDKNVQHFSRDLDEDFASVTVAEVILNRKHGLLRRRCAFTDTSYL